MRRLLRYLKAAWLYSQFIPYVESAEADDFWTEADEQKLFHFFQSQTGQKLRHKLNNYAIRAAMLAVKNPVHSQYQNGVAAGIPMVTVAIQRLSGDTPTGIESELTEAEAGLNQLEPTA